MYTLSTMFILLLSAYSMTRDRSCLKKEKDLSRVGFTKFEEFGITWTKGYDGNMIMFALNKEGDILEKQIGINHSQLKEYLNSIQNDSTKLLLTDQTDSVSFFIR